MSAVLASILTGCALHDAVRIQNDSGRVFVAEVHYWRIDATTADTGELTVRYHRLEPSAGNVVGYSGQLVESLADFAILDEACETFAKPPVGQDGIVSGDYVITDDEELTVRQAPLVLNATLYDVSASASSCEGALSLSSPAPSPR